EWAVARVATSARLAGAIGGEPLLGRIEPGAPADLVVLAYDPPTPLRSENLAGHWVFGMSSRHVRDVVVNGELVVRDGRLVRTDEAELRGRSREAGEELWRRVDETPAHPFEPAGGD
ncbi:MAG: amidohydrolase family protein, partial [Actinomycetota bacterium]